MSISSNLAEPQMNATPLIDVLLVLLVILIMTLPIATHAVKLNLPQPHEGTPPPVVRVDIFSDRSIYWDGEPIASDAVLAQKFLAAANASNPPLIRITPERRTPYERVVQVMAAAQRSHVKFLHLTSIPVDLP
jgi:biopolymer transport protein ExbD